MEFCESQNFKGWDPYDGLNSKVFGTLQMHRARFFRLAWIQLFKLNPFNLINLLLVQKEYNPKGLGLFLIGYCNLYKANPRKEYLEQINNLAKKTHQTQNRWF